MVLSGRVSPSQMIVLRLAVPTTDTSSAMLTSTTQVQLQSPLVHAMVITMHTVLTVPVVLDRATPTTTLETSRSATSPLPTSRRPSVTVAVKELVST